MIARRQIDMHKDGSVVVLHNEGCPATPKTIELIKECILELGIKNIDFQEVLIATQEEAEEWRFLGSPTVQVNGIDIDPSARNSNVFGFM
jgi:hypothetical protein